jgi:hypothetical protein
MEYFIFLKYLRSLEEFRKNSCVQITPKSPCANFQSLGIFKNLIFLKKKFLQLSAQSAQWPAAPFGLFGLERPSKLSQPASPPPSPSSLPHRVGGSIASSSCAATPWVPRCRSPAPWSDPNGCPSITRPHSFTRS